MSALQTKLKWLAEKAGYDTFDSLLNGPHVFLKDRDTDEFLGIVTVSDEGTLTDAECWMVLGWLAKAGYAYHGAEDDRVHQFWISQGSKKSGGLTVDIWREADTPNEALVAAVLALPL